MTGAYTVKITETEMLSFCQNYIAGCTRFQCSQWRKFRQDDDISGLLIPVTRMVILWTSKRAPYIVKKYVLNERKIQT